MIEPPFGPLLLLRADAVPVARRQGPNFLPAHPEIV